MENIQYKNYERVRDAIFSMLNEENMCNDCYCNVVSAIVDALVAELGEDALEWVKDSLKTMKEIEQEAE